MEQVVKKVKEPKEVKFRIKQLGNGSAFHPEKINSSFLVDLNGEYLLFDCGYNVFGELIRLNADNEIDLKKLKYVFLSHVDDDHIGSIKSLCYYMYFTYNKKLIVFGEYNWDQEIDYLWDLQANQCTHPNFLKDGEWVYEDFIENFDSDGWGVTQKYLSKKPFKLEAVPQSEHSKPTLGLFIFGPKSNLYISGDTRAIPTIEEYIKEKTKLTGNPTLLFHDYSNWDNEDNNVHMCNTNMTNNYSPSFISKLNYYHSDAAFDSNWKEIEDKYFHLYDPNILTDIEAGHAYLNGEILRRSVWPIGAKISLKDFQNKKNSKAILYENPLHSIVENSQYNDWRIIKSSK